MNTCALCYREDPPGGIRAVEQVSNPVTYAPCCRRKTACLLAALRAAWRDR